MAINYAIFAFKCSNPLGGMNDLYDTSDTLDNSILLAEELLTNNLKKINLNYFPEIAHIMCLKTGKLVKKIYLSDFICKSSDDEQDGDLVTTSPKKEIEYVIPVRVKPLLYKCKTYLQNIKNTMILYKENDPLNIEYSLCHNCGEIKLYLDFIIINNKYNICRECINL
jgi:hypothetical protein